MMMMMMMMMNDVVLHVHEYQTKIKTQYNCQNQNNYCYCDTCTSTYNNSLSRVFCFFQSTQFTVISLSPCLATFRTDSAFVSNCRPS